MTRILPIEPLEPLEPLGNRDWQPLPSRSQTLFLLGTMPVSGLAGLAAGGVLARLFDVLVEPSASLVAGAAIGMIMGLLFGLWLGRKQYRYTFWRLDDEGLALRRGKLWQRETRVPASRVQHLDLKRGPLQRGRVPLLALLVFGQGDRNALWPLIGVGVVGRRDPDHRRGFAGLRHRYQRPHRAGGRAGRAGVRRRRHRGWARSPRCGGCRRCARPGSPVRDRAAAGRA